MEDILFEQKNGQFGDIGIVTLNRPTALNALNHAMILALYQQLVQWEKNPQVKAVIVKAVPGRAFCAGGDVRSIYEKKMRQDPELMQFFHDEYVLNKYIFHFPKPYISFLDGITMGGGAGISIHGSHAIGTERLIFAMPETTIGFFPDVGSTYFLSRLPHHFGLYLGLTGDHISYSDAYYLGLVRYVISQNTIEQCIQSLSVTSLLDNANVNDIIQSLSIHVPRSNLLDHLDEVDACFSKNSIDEVIESLVTIASPWTLKIADILKTKSPMSLKITFAAINNAKNLSFDDCMKMEEKLMRHCLKGHDFFEGVRAALIDKDRSPKFNPANLQQISPAVVEEYFK